MTPYTLIQNWLDPIYAEQLFSELLTTVAWQAETIHMFGKQVTVPRKVAWYGDTDTIYRYSGVVHQPLPWITPLQALQHKLEGALSHYFNSVLCNLYNDGSHYMGWHRDNEPELGKDPLIASISLGATRRFLLRHRLSGETRELSLASGSLLVMHKGCQRHWQHSLPKMLKVTEPRINLTFRCVKEEMAKF